MRARVPQEPAGAAESSGGRWKSMVNFQTYGDASLHDCLMHSSLSYGCYSPLSHGIHPSVRKRGNPFSCVGDIIFDRSELICWRFPL